MNTDSDSAAGEEPDVRLGNPGVGTQIFKAVTACMAAVMYISIFLQNSL